MIELKLSDIADPLGAVLHGEDLTFNGCGTDTRQPLTGKLYVALQGERFDGHDFISQAQTQGAVAFLVDRPVTTSLPYLQVADTRKALGDLAKLWRNRFQIPLVAVTGSNGKTTVKELVKSILAQANPTSAGLVTRGNLNNDIGVPLTLLELNSEHRYAVIEMGANHSGEIAYLSKMASPHVAVITQCAPAHLEGFLTVEGVARAKGEIFNGLQAGGTAVINGDDLYASLWQELVITFCHPTIKIKHFALRAPAEISADELQLNQESSQFILHTPLGKCLIQLLLPGQHNVLNALAASACTLALGCSLADVQQGLQKVHPVKGRLQAKRGLNGITVLDDTYNANPTSLNAALAVLAQYPAPRWLVLGQMKELGPQSPLFHQQVGQLARRSGVESLWTIGELARFATESFGYSATHFDTHHELIDALKKQLTTTPGVTILVKGSRSMQMEKIVLALEETSS